eukprot:2554317-Amphidinium_carterae.1
MAAHQNSRVDGSQVMVHLACAYVMCRNEFKRPQRFPAWILAHERAGLFYLSDAVFVRKLSGTEREHSRFSGLPLALRPESENTERTNNHAKGTWQIR